MIRGELIFETKPDRGFTLKAWDLPDSKGTALVEVERDGELIRIFTFPAYKIWNISAHASDIIEGELVNSFSGYRIAGSDGLGGNVFG